MASINYLAQATQRLAQAGIGTARLDALVLLEDVTGIDRTQLLAAPDMEIPAAQVRKLTNLLKRRAGHEPLAYIRGRAEFYGREFVLTAAVLQPRAESETMIRLLKALPVFHGSEPVLGLRLQKSGPPVRIADVGAGSGALGITAVLELPKSQVELLEIDPAALKIAKINVDKFTLNLKVIRSDLLAQSGCDYDILLCNLPYVPDDYQINLAAGHEPRLAIFGGPDGLDVYRRLFEQVSKLQDKPLYILIEALPPQHVALEDIAAVTGYQLHQKDDFIQVFKCIHKPSSDNSV